MLCTTLKMVPVNIVSTSSSVSHIPLTITYHRQKNITNNLSRAPGIHTLPQLLEKGAVERDNARYSAEDGVDLFCGQEGIGTHFCIPCQLLQVRLFIMLVPALRVPGKWWFIRGEVCGCDER